MGLGYKVAKKLKPAFLKSQTGNETLIGTRKKDFQRSKKAQAGRSHVVDLGLSNDKFHKGRNSGERNLSSNMRKTQPRRVEIGGTSEFKPLHSGHKRKRIYAADHEEERHTKGAGKLSDLKLRTKAVATLGSAKKETGRNYSLKKHVTSILESNRHFNRSPKNSWDASLVKSSKTAALNNLGDSSVVMDDRSMKIKRVIRIDPHDITNKRLDDSIDNDESTKEKIEVSEKKMSKNAQFRAIQPSSSIHSFVEDNLLGRRRLIELRRAGYNIDLSAPVDNIPFSTSSERERIEEPMFRNKLTFFAAAKTASSFPPPELLEIAFAGRSNVGKSSLLNALTRQWGVARTSDKPGLTQTINFFKLGLKHCLVDLPGYGFAYAKEEVKDSWEELVKEYVSTRVGLKRVCLLIDTKWGMKPRDHELINLMERSQTKYQIVLTKTDTVFPMDVARRAMQIEESLRAHKSAVQPVMMVSSKTGAGIRSLRTVLGKIFRFAKI